MTASFWHDLSGVWHRLVGTFDLPKTDFGYQCLLVGILIYRRAEIRRLASHALWHRLGYDYAAIGTLYPIKAPWMEGERIPKLREVAGRADCKNERYLLVGNGHADTNQSLPVNVASSLPSSRVAVARTLAETNAAAATAIIFLIRISAGVARNVRWESRAACCAKSMFAATDHKL